MDAIKNFFLTMLAAIKAKMVQLLIKLKGLMFFGLIRLKDLIIKILTHPITVGLFAFFIGARMHEIGYLEGFFGKSLKGATVYLSGPCMVNGMPKIPALAEDEVKITGQDGDKFIGVIRKTREVVECDTKRVSIDKLPLLAKLNKSPVQIPELDAIPRVEKDPEWKILAKEKPTLMVSGVCSSASGQMIPAFTDAEVDVTNVQGVDGNPNDFILSGIRKEDKMAITCASNSIRFSPWRPKPAPVVPEKPKSYVGEVLLVTGICFPDGRIPKHAQAKKIAFYKLLNSQIQVTENEYDDSGKIKKIVGASISHKGAMVVCENEKYPFTWTLFDSESVKLSPMDSSDKEKNLPSTEKEVEEVKMEKTMIQIEPKTVESVSKPELDIEQSNVTGNK